MSGKINTVLGDASISELGFILTHEHLFSNFEYFYRKPAKKLINYIPQENYTLQNICYLRQYPYSSKYNLHLDDVPSYDAVLNDLKTYKLFGGGTIVETTCNGIDRDVNRLRALSEASGVQIVAGTGYYTEDVQADDTLNYTTEDLANNMTTELTYKCFETDPAGKNIRAGFIGDIASVWPLRDFERRAIKAAGEAQSQMGCGVCFSTQGSTEAPFEIIRLYQEAGGAADKAVMAHLDSTMLLNEHLLEFAKLGTYCQFDSFGLEISYNQRDVGLDMPTDAERINMIESLLEEKKQDRILMSHNIHSKHRLIAYGGHGYSHILNNVVKKMKEKGISKDVIDKITIDNPVNWLFIPTP